MLLTYIAAEATICSRADSQQWLLQDFLHASRDKLKQQVMMLVLPN
jgi:hypothetical protein